MTGSGTVSAGAFSSRTWDVRAVFDDNQAPVLTSDGETFGDRAATFFWHTNEVANHFCKLDSGAFEPCGTNSTFPAGKTYTGLSEGNHAFNVQAFDPSGQGSATLQRTITIVDTALTGGPAENELRNTRTATFNYSTVAGNAFECSIDFGAFEACGNGTSGSKTVTVGSDGTHNFRVRARNGGSVDPVAASRRLADRLGSARDDARPAHGSG